MTNHDELLGALRELRDEVRDLREALLPTSTPTTTTRQRLWHLAPPIFQYLNDEEWTCADLLSESDEALQKALAPYIKLGGMGAEALGKLLSKAGNETYNGYRFIRGRKFNGSYLWSVTPASPPPD